MSDNNHIQIQEQLEKEAKTKEKRKKKMKISSQSIKELAKIIKEKGQNKPK